MFSKSFIAAFFFLAFAAAVNAHAAVSPALGVSGTPVRRDVRRPNNIRPCGAGVNIAKKLDTSTAIPANANGSFTPTIINFNPGADGSRSVASVQVDASGTGDNFVPAQMVVNGNPAPTEDTSEQLTVQMPAGMNCTGGASGNLCLASFKTTAGFGNCVVVSQNATA